MPIEDHWTLGELLDSLAEADAPDDRMHPTLVRLERAVAKRADAPQWVRTPSAVALIRSLRAACADAPELRRQRLGALLADLEEPAAISA